MDEQLIVEARFNGPPQSAQGGLACGRFAERGRQLLGVTGPVTVTLHEPPPLDTPLEVERAGGRVHIWHGETLGASVSRTSAPIATLPCVAPEVVAAAERHHVPPDAHPFPTCFVCGPARTAGDGLALTPGRLPGTASMTGCRWTPDLSLTTGPGSPVPAEFAWAALDCPGGWTADLARTPMVLSRFTVDLATATLAGTPYVVIGRLDQRDAHTLTTTTALYRHDGVLTGRALARWVRYPPGATDG